MMPVPFPRTVRLSSGVSLSLVDQGVQSGPAAVLLHGLTDSWRSFARVLFRLPPSIRAVAMSQRGHGDSDKPDAGYRVGDFTADLAELLDSLALEKAVIVGHSSHGLVAQRFAIDHPKRVCGIVLESAFPTLSGNQAAQEFVKTSIAGLRDPIDTAFINEFQASTFLKPLPKWFVDGAVEDALKVPARVWRAGFSGLLEADHSAELAHIAVPALLIWGSLDPLVSRAQQDQLFSAIPTAELLVYEGVGHTPHWEEPERFADDLVAFVGRTQPPTRQL